MHPAPPTAEQASYSRPTGPSCKLPRAPSGRSQALTAAPRRPRTKCLHVSHQPCGLQGWATMRQRRGVSVCHRPRRPDLPGPSLCGDTHRSAAGTPHTPAALHPPWAPQHLSVRAPFLAGGRASDSAGAGLRAPCITMPWQWASLLTWSGDSSDLRRALGRAAPLWALPPTADPPGQRPAPSSCRTRCRNSLRAPASIP